MSRSFILCEKKPAYRVWFKQVIILREARTRMLYGGNAPLPSERGWGQRGHRCPYIPVS